MDEQQEQWMTEWAAEVEQTAHRLALSLDVSSDGLRVLLEALVTLGAIVDTWQAMCLLRLGRTHLRDLPNSMRGLVFRAIREERQP